MTTKLFSFDTLQRFCDLCSGLQSLVHCHGCFDLLHLGHVRHLQAAKRLGGLLVVTVTPDRLVNKGAGRPVFSEEYRAEMVAALECVDCVAVNCWATAAEAIWWLKPAIYCKGADSRFNETQGLRDEREAVESVGGRLEFTDELTFHSSDLIHLLRTPNDVYAEVAS